jgi:hypothetical protein
MHKMFFYTSYANHWPKIKRIALMPVNIERYPSPFGPARINATFLYPERFRNYDHWRRLYFDDLSEIIVREKLNNLYEHAIRSGHTGVCFIGNKKLTGGEYNHRRQIKHLIEYLFPTITVDELASEPLKAAGAAAAQKELAF